MSEQRDPPRWLDSHALSPELHEQFVTYGASAPGEVRRERMFAELERQLAEGAQPTVEGALSAKLKLVLGLGSLVIGSLALLALWWAEPVVSAPAPVEVTSIPSAVAPIVSVPPELAPALELPSPVVADAPAQAKPRKLRAASERDKAPPLLQPTAPTEPPPITAQAAASPAATVQGPLGELTLLARARRALLVEPERALALAEEHARLYREGTFSEEREVLAIESLLKLHRTQEAERRVAAFMARFPRSSHREHLARLVSSDRAAMIDADAEE